MASLCDSLKMRLGCYSYDMAAGTFPGNCNDMFFNMELGRMRVSRYSKAELSLYETLRLYMTGQPHTVPFNTDFRKL